MYCMYMIFNDFGLLLEINSQQFVLITSVRFHLLYVNISGVVIVNFMS